MADPLKEYVEPSSIFADRKKLPPQKFGDDNYENMVNYIMRHGVIAPTKIGRSNEMSGIPGESFSEVYSKGGSPSEIYDAFREGYLRPSDVPEESWRQKSQNSIASAAEYLGMNPYEARKFAGNLTGDANQSIAEGFGVADITPAGLVFAANEAYRDLGTAESKLDALAGVVGGAFSVAEAFPLTKAMTRPALAWLKSITSKAAVPRSEKVDAIVAADKVQDNLDEMITGEVPTQQYDDDGVLGNLPDPTTVNRREVMGGLSALGVTAAAPSVMKIVDDIPLPVKAAVERVPPPSELAALSEGVRKTRSFNDLVNDVVEEYDVSPREAADMALESIQGIDEVFDSLVDEGDNIKNWLDSDEAGLDNYFEKFGTQAPTGYEDDAYYVIEELMGEPYFMTKAEVGEWFKKEGIID